MENDPPDPPGTPDPTLPPLPETPQPLRFLQEAPETIRLSSSGDIEMTTEEEPTPRPIQRPRPVVIPTPRRGKRTAEGLEGSIFAPSNIPNPFLKRARFTGLREEFNSSSEYIDAALDCLIKATNLENDKKKTENLLDLISIFREYTGNAKIDYSKSILATQVRAVEVATRTLSNKVRNISIPPPIPIESKPNKAKKTGEKTSYASVASQGKENLESEGFTLVSTRKKPIPTSPLAPKKPTLVERQITLKYEGIRAEFKPYALRERLNKAFENAGFRNKAVISGVYLSIKNNIVLTANEGYTASFLLDKRVVIEKIFPKSPIRTNESWYKVAIHGIPTQELKDLDLATVVRDEFKTFNPNLKVVGAPYWLTVKEKRENQLAGSICVAFKTSEEQRRAISNRLYLLGVSCKAEKLLATPRETVCRNCLIKGHETTRCTRKARCGICQKQGHRTEQHLCPYSGCKSLKGRPCRTHDPVPN